MNGPEPLDPTQLRQGPIRCGWWPTFSIKAVFDVIGAYLGMERFEIGSTAANYPLSSIEDRYTDLPIQPKFQQITGRMPMKPMELFQRAVAEIGEVSAVELSEHLEKKHGVKIEPAFIPLFKATLQDLERTNKLRHDAKPIGPKESTQAD